MPFGPCPLVSGLALAVTYGTPSAVNKVGLFAFSARQSFTHADRNKSGRRNVLNANAIALTKACDLLSKRKKWEE